MAQLMTWPRPALYTAGALALAAVLGWGVAIERNARVTAERQAVAATDARARSLEQRAATAEADVARQRQASGELDAVTQRLAAARGQLDRTEARTRELQGALEEAERRAAGSAQQAAAEGPEAWRI